MAYRKGDMLEIDIKELYVTLKKVKPFLGKDTIIPYMLSEYVEVSNKGIFCTDQQITVRFKWYHTEEFCAIVNFQQLWGLVSSLYKMDKSASISITKGVSYACLTYKGNAHKVDIIENDYVVTEIKPQDDGARVDNLNKLLSFAKVCGKRQRYALDTLQVKTEGEHIRVTATDGARLLTAKIEASHGKVDMLISGAHALKLAKALKGTVSVSDGFFVSANVQAQFKTVQDSFPPVDKIIGIEYYTCVKLITKELVNWVRVLSSLPGNEKLEFVNTGGLSLVSSLGNSFKIGRFDKEIEPIKFDAKLMLSLLAFCNEHVDLYLKEGNAPIKGKSGDVTFFLMPIKGY